jgi:hypothetical protein
MVNSKRRLFLRRSGAMAVAGALSACGAGAGRSENGADATAASPSNTLAATLTSTVTSSPLAKANFTLTSATTQSRAPYTLGYAFKKGDIPNGSSVTADNGTLQVIPKNRWPDGSLKFAVLSGIVDLTANTPKTINLSGITSPAAGTALDLTRLRMSNISAEVSAGAFGTAKWTAADWSSPFATWVTGPVMSSWIYRKPVGNDPHLVAWLEVRMWSNGAVEVLPWIENGYILVPNPTNKSAQYSFSLGGSQRFSAAINLMHHQRTPLISGSALSYWLSTDASVTVAHNKEYLQATELVPSYMAQVDASSSAIKGLVSAYQPLQAGNFKFDGDSMGSSGYQEPIGLLPQHDVLYLISNAPEAYGAVVRNGFSAGRWSIHYRDEHTFRPLRFSSYPNLNIGDRQGFKDTGGSSKGQYTPMPTGGSPGEWDVAHSPSVGYLAYLVTGRWYFMEEVQFAATANYLGNGDNSLLRNGAQGLVQPCMGAWQTRSAGWDWRTRVQALSVTPDDDTALRNEFIASVEANIAHFHGRYVAQANNPYGFIQPGGSYDGTVRLEAPWMQDFVTAAFGMSISMGLPISAAGATKLAQFFQWKAKSIVMRLGTKSGFWYINADPYVIAITPSGSPDYVNGTGPWYATEAEVYAATFDPAVAKSAGTSMAWKGSTEGVLAGEIMPGAESMWGNLQPAIAYAVRHGVPGASDAYKRMTSASNWGALRDAFNYRPVWSVQPSGAVSVAVPPPVVVTPDPVESTAPVAGMPAWASRAPLNQWIEIPNTAGAGGATINPYSGWAFVPPSSELVCAAAGGHADSSDNRVTSIRLTDDAPAWKVRRAPSASAQSGVAYYSDGAPSSRHVYHMAKYIAATNRIMLMGARFTYSGSGTTFATVDGFNLATNQWDPAGTWPNIANFDGSGLIDGNGDYFGNSGLTKFSATGGWSYPAISGPVSVAKYPWAWDSKRKQQFGLCYGDGERATGATGVKAEVIRNGVRTYITWSAASSSALAQFHADRPFNAGMDYDQVNDKFLFYCGGEPGLEGRFYIITPNDSSVWDMTVQQASTQIVVAPSGVMSRMSYVPALKGFVMMPDTAHNMYFMRTA